jgi:hypothetical protein
MIGTIISIIGAILTAYVAFWTRRVLVAMKDVQERSARTDESLQQSKALFEGQIKTLQYSCELHVARGKELEAERDLLHQVIENNLDKEKELGI